jgi:hypothetical protein
MLSAPYGVSAQRQVWTPEFTVTAYIFALKIPNPMVANADGTPMISGPGVWMAIKNMTAIPYFLCVTGTGWMSPSLGGMVGGTADSCSPAWIVLPGETHFQGMKVPTPKTPQESWTVSIMLEGKPVGAAGNLTKWDLSWTGTAEEAARLGEQIKANVP